MSKLIVFDVDGTILNSFALYEKAVLHYSQDQNLPIPCMDTIRMGYGDPHNHDFKWGVDKQAQFDHLMGTFKLATAWETSGDPAHIPHLFDGVETILSTLKNMGHMLAVVTSRPSNAFLHTTGHHGIDHYFSAVRTGCDVRGRGEKEKPEPDQLLSVMRELGYNPETTVMVGDTVMDVKMGRNAGTHTIGVTWGVHPRQNLVDAGAHYIVDTHISDILGIIDQV